MRAKTATIALGILLGAALGVGSYAFIYARGYSYLSNNPEACTNCHVMVGITAGGRKAAITRPRNVTTATPRPACWPSMPPRPRTDSSTRWHSRLGRYPDSIQIKNWQPPRNRRGLPQLSPRRGGRGGGHASGGGADELHPLPCLQRTFGSGGFHRTLLLKGTCHEQ